MFCANGADVDGRENCVSVSSQNVGQSLSLDHRHRKTTQRRSWWDRGQWGFPHRVPTFTRITLLGGLDGAVFWRKLVRDFVAGEG